MYTGRPEIDAYSEDLVHGQDCAVPCTGDISRFSWGHGHESLIVVRCDYIPRIQEVQASIYHVLTEVWRRLTAQVTRL